MEITADLCLSGSHAEPRVKTLHTRRISHDSEPLLSYRQQRLWAVYESVQHRRTNNLLISINLRGSISASLLERSLHEIIRRHEVLRTSFVGINGKPIARIAPEFELVLATVNLSDSSEDELEEQIHRLKKKAAEHPFDAGRCPLLLAQLVCLPDEGRKLLLAIDPLVCDVWSIRVLLREMASVYKSFSKDHDSPLAELSIQFAQLSSHQNEWVESEGLESAFAYWQQRFGTAPPRLELPISQMILDAPSHQVASHTIEVSETLGQSLKEFTTRRSSSLFAVLLTAFKVLLHRYTGHEDLAIGCEVANRRQPAMWDMIGPFANTVVLRSDLSGDPSFQRVLGRVEKNILEAREHEGVAFEKILEALDRESGGTQGRLFEVGFVLEAASEPDDKLAELVSDYTLRRSGRSDFDLNLLAQEKSQGLVMTLEYKANLFEHSTIKRLLNHFEIMLQNVINGTDLRISSIPLLTETERHQISIEWNDTQVERADRVCVDRRFESQVEKTPDKIAVFFENAQLTYRELNRRANQVAHYLRGRGVGEETIVAIQLERSLETIVAMLGTLKAGAAYAPLDPAYPKERLSLALKDLDCPVLLTQTRLADGLPKFAGEVICLDADWQAIAQQSIENTSATSFAENLAYVIYTSGSTGIPKGVMINHQSLASYTEVAGIAYGVAPDDRILQFASISFDTSAEEIYPCLTRGATLVLRTGSMISSAALFLEKCREWGLTILDLPTAYWHELMRNSSREDWALADHLRLVIIGGEKALPEQLGQWEKLIDRPVHLVNTYGPTEATIVSTMWWLPSDLRARTLPGEVPIGIPIDNAQAYNLDDQLQLVAAGAAGQLHISGHGLSRGYLNRPDLTAERFIPNPYGQEPGARMYRTGDRVRHRADGQIEFLGRTDHQVKIRGFRLELGEVEAALRTHSDVAEAVTLLKENAPGDKRLVAYVVSQAPSNPSISDLSSHLKSKLPSYMIPSAYVLLERLPLTPGGKVDRRALLNLNHDAQAKAKPLASRLDFLEGRLMKISDGFLKGTLLTETDQS